MTERWETVRLPDGRDLEAVVQGDEAGTLLIFHHGPRSRGAVRGLRSGRGRTRDQPGLPFPTGVRRLDPAGGPNRRETFLTAGWSGGGPHALACAALLPDRVLAAATIAGVAPYDAEGLEWTAGMGEDNQVEYSLAARDPEALLEWMRPRADALAPVEPADIVRELRSIISAVDEQQVTGAFGEMMADSFHRAFRDGLWGWYDDDLAFVRDWGFDVGSIRVPVSIWRGREDLMVPFAHGEWLVRHIPTVRSHLHPEHGHLSLAVGRIGEILDDLLEASGAGASSIGG